MNLPEYLQNPLVLIGIFGGSGLITTILTPLVIRFARKIGAIDRGGYRRSSSGSVPLLGGLGIAAPVTVIYFIFGLAGILIVAHWKFIFIINQDWLNPLMDYAAGRSEYCTSFIVMTVGGLAVLFLGLIDDLKGMRARIKLLGQLIIAVYICASGYYLQSMYIPLVGAVEFAPGVGIMISIIWIVGLINAFNLIDGLDGLATGIALIASIALAILGATNGNVFIVISCSVLAGSLAGFLVFNFPPASIFLGDTGSMFIGYSLATITLMGTYKAETAIIVLAPMLALSFPIFETLISMVRRFIRGVPIFSGDYHHTHHRLLEKGFSKRQAVLILYLVTILLAGSAYLSQIFPRGSVWSWLPGFVFAGTLIGIAWWAGYLRRSTLGRIFHRHRRNTVLAAFSHYAIQSLTSRSAVICPPEILNFCRRELRLCFLQAWFEEGGVIIGSSGQPVIEASTRENIDSIERIRVKTVGGLTVILRYQFLHEPVESEFEDVTACLAGIFEQAGVNLLLNKAISLQGEIEDQTILEEIERELSTQ